MDTKKTSLYFWKGCSRLTQNSILWLRTFQTEGKNAEDCLQSHLKGESACKCEVAQSLLTVEAKLIFNNSKLKTNLKWRDTAGFVISLLRELICFVLVITMLNLHCI